MAFSNPVSATQVGSYFVGQYYQILRKQPELAHQFYTDSSTMIRVDGDSTETATDLLHIHNMVATLQFTSIEIKTINSLESWNGCVLVVVSGCIGAEYFGGKRNYVETFLLAPQDKGFFVLNDVFHFMEEETIQQHPVPVFSENGIDSQQPSSNLHQEMPGYTQNHYDFETEASEYVDSVHIDGHDQINGYNVEEQQEHLQQQPQVLETYEVLESIPQEAPQHETFVEPLVEHQHSVEQPVAERPKLSYASILKASKGPTTTAAGVSQPSNAKSVAPSEWQQPLQAPQQPTVTAETSYETPYESPSLEEVEILKSVYVRNLPSDVTAAEIEQEFKTFGKIIPDGVFIRKKAEIGVCYAFVEYEDIQAVYNAIQASPLQFDGRNIYVEERRANTSSGAPRGGGRRGGGRGSYQSDSSYRGQSGGRSSSRGGGYQDGGDYNRYRSNGFRG